MGCCRQIFGVAVMFSLGAFACGQPTPDAPLWRSDYKTPTPSSTSAPTATPTPTPPPPTPTPTPPDPGSGSPRTAPRLIAPLSTSISMSMSPLFTWLPESPTTGATVDVCRDRACQNIVVSFAATGSSAQPPRPLPPGVVFWRVSSATTGGRTSAVWELTIPARESGRTGSWGSVPDFNGDGFGDLAVGVLPAFNGVGAPPPNQLRFFPGGPGGPAATPAQTFSGPDGFAEEAGSAGDLDGDGFADLAIWNGPPTNGAPGQATVTVYPGGPQGLSSPVTLSAPDAPFTSQMRVLGAGDVNGDGYGDLLVGGGSVAELFLGGPTGVSTTPVEMLAPPAATTPDAEWPIGNGDFNGDGHPDAVISGLNGGLLYDGDGQTLIAHPEVPLPNAFGGLAGDFNGDGFADLASSAIMTGGPSGPTTSFQAIAGERFYLGVGDVNGDGFSDVLSTVSSLVGVLETQRLYFGAQTGCTSTACSTFVPLLVPGSLNNGNGLFAEGAKGLGDVNGDGFADFVFFSPGVGAVYLFFGSPAGPPSNPSLTITAEQGFGFSVAGM